MNASGAARDFWTGKRVLVTGHTGFKGAWLTLWLHRMGARVSGMALPPASRPNLHGLARIGELCTGATCDVRNAQAVRETIRATRPEIVFHLAAQSLVRPSYEDPVETFSTNVMGTAHVLEALRGLDTVRVAVMVTTDKVYRNTESGAAFTEDDALGGHDPYSASKAASEVVIESYRQSFLAAQGVGVASARAGNVIGGGDWARDRLVPDAVRAWSGRELLTVRRPDAVRPWQHVLEPLAGYMFLAQRLWSQPRLAGAYNFGPDTAGASSVRHIVERLQREWLGAEAVFAESEEGPHEAQLLSLDTHKARGLGFRPRWTLDESLARTAAWYRKQGEGEDARSLCDRDIADYEAAA